MAEDLDSLKADRLKLRRAIRSGALSVRHGDKAVQYRSLADMNSALDDLDAEIAELEGKRRSRVRYINAVRGY